MDKIKLNRNLKFRDKGSGNMAFYRSNIFLIIIPLLIVYIYI